MAGPAELVAPDRLQILGYGVGDANLVREKPRLIHTTRDRVSLDLEDRDPDGVEHVCARDVENYGTAPATADAGGTGAVCHRYLERADDLVTVRIDEPPTPLESDDVHIERVRVVRRVLQERVERERVQGEAKEKGHQKRGQDRREGGVPAIGHDADPRRVLGLWHPGLSPVPDEEIEEDAKDGPGDDYGGDDVQCEQRLPLLRRRGKSRHERRVSASFVKRFQPAARAYFRIFKWGSPMPDIGERDGGWSVGRRGGESRVEAGRFVARDRDCRRRCGYGSGDGLGRLPRVADIADWPREVLGHHAGFRLRQGRGQPATRGEGRPGRVDHLGRQWDQRSRVPAVQRRQDGRLELGKGRARAGCCRTPRGALDQFDPGPAQRYGECDSRRL